MYDRLNQRFHTAQKRVVIALAAAIVSALLFGGRRYRKSVRPSVEHARA